MDKFECQKCHEKYNDKESRFCPYCGDAKTVPENEMLVSYPEDIPELIKKTKKIMNDQQDWRHQINFQRDTLEKLISLAKDKNNNVLIEANGKKLRLKETTFRLAIQNDVEYGYRRLKKMVEITEKYNKEIAEASRRPE